MYVNEIIAPAFMGPLAIFRCFHLSRSYPDRDSSSLNPPAGGTPPRWGVGRTMVWEWECAPLGHFSLSFQLEGSTWTLRVEAAHTGPAPRLNPPDGGASPLGGQFFLFCILMKAETHLRRREFLLAVVVSRTPGGIADIFSSRFHCLPRIGSLVEFGDSPSFLCPPCFESKLVRGSSSINPPPGGPPRRGVGLSSTTGCVGVIGLPSSIESRRALTPFPSSL